MRSEIRLGGETSVSAEVPGHVLRMNRDTNHRPIAGLGEECGRIIRPELVPNYLLAFAKIAWQRR